MPRLVYLLPLSALFIAALSLFISPVGAITFARLVGGPTDQGASFHGRVQVLREEVGVIHPAQWVPFTLRATQGDHTSTLHFQTDAEGWAEVSVPRIPERPLALQVLDPRGTSLVQGVAQLSRVGWLEAAPRRRSNFRAHEQAGLRVCLYAPSVIFAVPFEQPLVVHVGPPDVGKDCHAPAGPGLSGVSIHGEVTGAEVRGSISCVSDAAGTCRFHVRPFHHQVSVQLRAQLLDTQLQFEETLPVVPGAFGITLGQTAEQPISVVSPIARDHAWYSLVSERGRELGGRLALIPRADGTSQGQLKLSAEQRRGAFLVLSSEPDGPSKSAVGYPLDGQDHTLDTWDADLLHGAARARLVAARRALRVRLALGGYSLLSIVLSVVLFWADVRRRQGEVDRAMSASGLPTPARAGTTPLIVAVLCVFFAFSATLVWIVTR